ncbi:hypothetical protein H70357_21885 [Paenibacillus sp. FSL H7-0357]|uniref:hypothetical protein n=1 Tax=unclassified Paenibacillus TaxID=185978 RepID=UPI0004F6B590|nr:hypothetical protein [Paenibacillus sp. FSL H7-0357]AIQ19063.1 hypothetical protein H70357_21885 [Paenibacillus sp. FSL H7-0357]
MVQVKFYDLNTVEDKKLLFAVMMTKFNGQWLYVRHKDINTWEIPGGQREENTVEQTVSFVFTWV